PFFWPLRGRRPRGGRGPLARTGPSFVGPKRAPLAGRRPCSGSVAPSYGRRRAAPGRGRGEQRRLRRALTPKGVGAQSSCAGRWVAGVEGWPGSPLGRSGTLRATAEPAGAARPSRFAVAQARAWHPPQNRRYGGAARPTEGSPRPPGGVVAGAADRGPRRWGGNRP